jgi:hypothetical protein
MSTRTTPESWEVIPDAEWAVYHEVIRQARSAGIPCAFGGAFATAVYTGQLRNTKDFDFYVLPQDRDRMIEVLDRIGLRDYFDRLAYDRSWIYRASRDDIIVDTIWQMANGRAPVDEQWLTRGPEVTIRGERVRAIPVEELLWTKLYVLQRERSDWPDVLSLVDSQADAIDWDRLIGRLGGDAPLLQAVLLVYRWLAPGRSCDIPEKVWAGLEPTGPCRDDPQLTRQRAGLLDGRPWFRLS